MLILRLVSVGAVVLKGRYFSSSPGLPLPDKPSIVVLPLERNPHPVRKEYALKVLTKAIVFIHTDDHIEERARAFQAEGIKPVDALHLASAVIAKAEYFCTCDDRFLKRAKAADTGQTKVVSPLELIAEVTQ